MLSGYNGIMFYQSVTAVAVVSNNMEALSDIKSK